MGCCATEVQETTYIDNAEVASGLPVVGTVDQSLQAEDLLDVVHPLDKVPLAEALVFALAVVLQQLPRVCVSATQFARVIQRKRGLCHILLQLCLTALVLLQSIGEDAHSRASIVHKSLDQRPKASVLQQRSGARGVTDARCERLAGVSLLEYAQGVGVVEDTVDNFFGQADVLCNVCVRGIAVNGYGRPEVEVVECVE